MKFSIATTLDEALGALTDGARPVAGGTDLVVGARGGKAPLPDAVIAIDRLAELSTITPSDAGTRIGALVTHATLMTDSSIIDDFTAVADASALVGSPSTRNVGTLGGNVMNGSPAMDTGAPLVVLGATVELASTEETRTIGLDELWVGPGQTSARPDELCTALVLPTPPASSGSAYVRLEYRRAMEIAVVGAAASVTLDAAGAIEQLRVALTAVAPTIVEVSGLDDLLGRAVDDDLLGAVAERAAATATPISDLRASDAYRRHTVGVMARRAVEAAERRARGDHIAVPVNRSVGVGAA